MHFLATPHEFDVIVTDQTMPLMSGTDFARIVQACTEQVQGNVTAIQ